MHIIAFDSGLERTGYAVFEMENKDYELATYGCIETSKTLSLEQRIGQIQNEVLEMIHTYSPSAFALEKLFFTVNKKSAISVAQAQGAVLALAGLHNIKVDFLTPNQIKQSLTGYGNADKKSVEKMVMLTLDIKEAPKLDDTSDAIACGLTYCTMNALHDWQT